MLEWFAFLMGIVSVYCYGKSKKNGGIAGIICSLSFIAWGSIYGSPAAILTNIFFFIFHTRNLIIAIGEENEQS